MRGIRHCKRPAVDFGLAFTPGHKFEDDGERYEMEVREAGELYLPSGRIVAGEPPVGIQDPDGSAFERRVPPGRYPVDRALLSGYNACLRVRFREAPVTEWVIATRPGEDPEQLKPFEIFGYGVDGGEGAFAAPEGLRYVMDSGGDVFSHDDYYPPSGTPWSGASAADVLLDPTTGANMVICMAGHGDGFYASYWGLGTDGEPVCLVTDFGLLHRYVEETRELGRLTELAAAPPIELPGELEVTVRLPDRESVLLEARGSTSDQTIFELWPMGRGERFGGTPPRLLDPGKLTLEFRFAEPIADETVLVVTYVDRIEPLL